jgi:hypothetical protein
MGGKRTLGNIRLNHSMLANLRILTVMAFLPLSAACAPEPGAAHVVKLGAVEYKFPSREVSTVQVSDFHDYVRLKPSDDYLIVYSKRKNYRRNEQGSGVPTVAHINDVPYQKIEVIQSPDGPIVCREARGLRFECGMRIIDAGLFWSLTFDRAKLRASHSIFTEATNKLASYRG